MGITKEEKSDLIGKVNSDVIKSIKGVFEEILPKFNFDKLNISLDWTRYQVEETLNTSEGKYFAGTALFNLMAGEAKDFVCRVTVNFDYIKKYSVIFDKRKILENILEKYPSLFNPKCGVCGKNIDASVILLPEGCGKAIITVDQESTTFKLSLKKVNEELVKIKNKNIDEIVKERFPNAIKIKTCDQFKEIKQSLSRFSEILLRKPYINVDKTFLLCPSCWKKAEKLRNFGQIKKFLSLKESEIEIFNMSPEKFWKDIRWLEKIRDCKVSKRILNC